jgi:hypothetical protein
MLWGPIQPCGYKRVGVSYDSKDLGNRALNYSAVYSHSQRQAGRLNTLPGRVGSFLVTIASGDGGHSKPGRMSL